jgi:iron complex transport system substrate-binding protein
MVRLVGMCMVLLAAYLTAATAATVAAVTVRDDAGRTVVLQQPAQRIVSLAPHATELLFAAGAGGRLVGVAAYSDFPADAAALPQVGDAHALDLERIVALRPDLVVAWASGNSRQQVDRLAATGIPVFFSEPRVAEDVASNLQRLGALAGTAREAKDAAAHFRGALADLEQRYRGARPVSVFYEIWHTPPMTLSGRHFVSDMLARCGARNVFADLPALTPTLSVEAVIAAAPEVIATGAGAEAADFWRGRREIPAAHHGRVCEVDATRMHRAGPRLADAAAELCECIDGARRR